MADYIYIDNSNLYIEGRRVSAVASGLAKDIYDAMQNGILDQGYTISFGKLHQFLTDSDPSKTKRAALFGSRPPPNDGIWGIAKSAGFTPHLEDRNAANKEKKIDTGIVTLMLTDAFTTADPSQDTIVLVAGDGDFVPAINALRARGFNVDLVFWDHASKELKQAASRFISLNQYLDHLRL